MPQELTPTEAAIYGVPAERARADRLELALAAARLGDWEWDPATDLVTLSPRAAEIFGLPAGEGITWTRMQQMLVEPDAARARKAVEASVAARTDYDIEYRVRQPSGAMVWVAAKGRGRYDAAGAVVGMTGIVQDITARKKAEETAAFLATIVASSPDAIVSKDINGKITSWNSAAERLFGFTREEAVGSSISLIIPPDRMNEEASIIQTVKRGERIAELETVRRTKSGELVEVSITVAPLVNDSGDVIGVAKIARSLADRRASERRIRTEAAVIRSLATARNSVEAIHNFLAAICEQREWSAGAYWRLDPGAAALQCAEFCSSRNTHALRALEQASHGRTFARGEGLPGLVWQTGAAEWWENIGASPDLPRHAAFAAAGLNTGCGFPVILGETLIGVVELFSYEHFRRDDSFVQLLRGLANQLAQFVERKRVEENLRENEARLRTALDAGKLGAWEWDITRNTVIWSDRIYEFHGLSRGEFDGTVEGFAKLIHPDDLQRVQQSLANAMQRREPYELEFRTVRPDGSVRWLATSARVIFDDSGKPTRMVGGTVDLTERKQAELELRRAQRDLQEQATRLEETVQSRTAELQRTLHAVESLCYTIAHDLRAPLRAMQGFARALVEECSDQLDETGQLYTRRIVRASQRMDTLITDLLAYGRLGTVEMTLGPVDLDSVIHGFLLENAEEIRAKGATIEVQRGMPVVIGNSTVLGQALANLLLNAIKFVAPGVQPNIRVWAERGPGIVRVNVADNGIGIAPEHRGKLFQIFQRLHSPDQYPGTGIGLAIVKKAMERMNGTTSFTSEPGKGSTFWIEVPAARLEPRSNAPGRSECVSA